MTTAASAQWEHDDRVLRPSGLRPMLGIALGGAVDASTGHVVTSCNCTYAGGWGINPAAAVVMVVPVSRVVRISAALQYAATSTSYTAQEVRSEFVANTGQYEDVAFERTVDVRLAYAGASIAALISSGVGGLHLIAGCSALTPVRDRFTEEERILTPGVVYPATSTASKTYVDGTVSDLYTRRDLRLTADLGVGWDIAVRPRLVVTPRLIAAVPLTSVVVQNADWRVVDVRIDATLLYVL